MATTPPNAGSTIMSQTASGVPVRVVPNGWRPAPDNLTLTVAELTWLDRFRAQLLEEFPEIIEDIIVYGHRARGIADLSLEFKVLVVAENVTSEIKPAIMEIGHRLESLSYAGATVSVVTLEERAAELERNRKSIFVEEPRVGISVL